MRSSFINVWPLAVSVLAAAAAAQPASCSDDCARQLQADKPDQISAFCRSFTGGLYSTSLPSFVSECGGSVAQISSACSCAVPSPTATTNRAPKVPRMPAATDTGGCPPSAPSTVTVPVSVVSTTTATVTATTTAAAAATTCAAGGGGGSTCDAIQNGSFETGDFTGWAVKRAGGSVVGPTGGVTPVQGNYMVQLPGSAVRGTWIVSQSIATCADTTQLTVLAWMRTQGTGTPQAIFCLNSNCITATLISQGGDWFAAYATFSVSGSTSYALTLDFPVPSTMTLYVDWVSTLR